MREILLALIVAVVAAVAGGVFLLGSYKNNNRKG